MIKNKEFATALLQWYEINGRKDLPWQHPRSAYRVWISEIMLQQTQVQTVIPYFNRFMTSYPDVQALACAPEDEVLSHWSGLGYYSRIRNIHKTAKLICNDYAGIIQPDMNTLLGFPGIGPSTAAAILSQAFNLPAPILDGNVKRVLSRHFMVEGWPEQSRVKNKLWVLAELCMPQEHCADYTQAIMDLGATCCTSRKPDCNNCPVKTNCLAFLNDKVMDFPTKKQKKELPVKRQQFLLFYNENLQIFLEKRPPSGLWGGLWCLPDTEVNADLPLEVDTRFGLKIREVQPITELKHTFSHFHLYIRATALKTSSTDYTTCHEGTGKWFFAHELGKLGLARPVSKIINCFFDTIQVSINNA